MTSSGKCTWKAATSGSGKLVAANVKWGEYQTYVDYGCVPESMMENCQINIVKDLSVRPTVSLPENMQVGDTITPTVTNLIVVWTLRMCSNTHGRMETAARFIMAQRLPP